MIPSCKAARNFAPPFSQPKIGNGPERFEVVSALASPSAVCLQHGRLVMG